MPVGSLLAFVMFMGIGLTGNSIIPSFGSAGAAYFSSNGIPKAGIRLPSASRDESDLRYYPLSNYRRYPARIRPLLQRVDLEHGRCAGTGHSLRACDRMDRIVRRLERLGWCWGSVDAMAPEADKYWLRCSRRGL